MTVTNTVNKVVADCNGVTTLFAFDFLIPASGDEVIKYTDVDGNISVLNNTQYTVNGFGNTAGGTVLFPKVGAAKANGTLTIARELPLVQETSISNQGAFYPQVVEAALDYLTMCVQQLNEVMVRCLKAPIVDDTTVPDLVPAAQRANMSLLFDALGNPIAGQVASVPVSAAMVPVVQAVTLAVARTAMGLKALATEDIGAMLKDDGTGKLTLDLGTLVKDDGAGKLTLDLGLWLKDDGNGKLTLNAGSGLADDGTGKLHVGLANGLAFDGNGNILAQIHGQCLLRIPDANHVSLIPHNGNLIRIAGVTYQIPAAGITVGTVGVYVNGAPAQNLVANNTYDVYVFNNNGALTLEFVNNVTHATDTTAGNVGVEIKAGDPSRTFVGKIRVNASTQFSDSGPQRFCINWFRGSRSIKVFSVTQQSASTTSTASVELTSALRMEFLTWADESVFANYGGSVTNAAGATAHCSVGVDGAGLGPDLNETFSAAQTAAMTPTVAANIAEGYHYFTLMAQTASGTASYNMGGNGIIRG